jgi:hypothetical protein
MATAANLAGIGRRGLLERIVAAAKVVRVATIVVPVAVGKAEVVKEEDQKGATRAGPAEADVRSMGSPRKSSWRS